MILGLPAESFWLLLGVPGIVLLVMLIDSFRIWRRTKQDADRNLEPDEHEGDQHASS